MRLTKIYLRKYSKVGLLTFGVIASFFLSEAAAYFSSDNSKKVDSTSIEKTASKSQISDTFSKKGEVDLADPHRPDQKQIDYHWQKVNSLTVVTESGLKKHTIVFEGIYPLAEFPYRIRQQANGDFWAFVPIPEPSKNHAAAEEQSDGESSFMGFLSE